jgi:REP element-mobilizing transposase RayT
MGDRRSLRLRGYDYPQAGVYFVTVCTQGRVCLFGEVVDGEMRMNEAGVMVKKVWEEIPRFYRGVALDEFVVMPNHVHGIIVLVGAGPRACPGQKPHEGQPQGVAPTMMLADVVHRFKTMTTRRYAAGVERGQWPAFERRVWQRGYYEHVIRDEPSLDAVRAYVADNPSRWAYDRENPGAVAPEAKDAWMR